MITLKTSGLVPSMLISLSFHSPEDSKNMDLNPGERAARTTLWAQFVPQTRHHLKDNFDVLSKLYKSGVLKAEN